MAAARASRLATATSIGRLADLDERMVAAGEASRWNVIAELDAQFHLEIARLSGSRRLRAALQEIAVDRLADLLDPSLLAGNGVTMCHAPILDAMRSGEHEIAGDLMRRHVLGWGRTLVKV